MKNKTFTYILLIVVAIVWYQVFFRVKGSLFGEDEVDIPAVNQPPMGAPVIRDTFSLLANYRDPFGETKRNLAEELNKLQEQPQPPKQKAPPPSVYWPPIKYYGLVKKSESKTPLAIVSVDGIQLMVRKGEELFDGIMLNVIYRDSIQVKNKREKRTFWRQ